MDINRGKVISITDRMAKKNKSNTLTQNTTPKLNISKNKIDMSKTLEVKINVYLMYISGHSAMKLYFCRLIFMLYYIQMKTNSDLNLGKIDIYKKTPQWNLYPDVLEYLNKSEIFQVISEPKELDDYIISTHSITKETLIDAVNKGYLSKQEASALIDACNKFKHFNYGHVVSHIRESDNRMNGHRR